MKGISHEPERRGFTLVELLVTVAIVAILIAIIIPQLVKSKESAKRAVCQSNLHQLVIGYQLYGQDADNMGRPVPANTSITSGKFWAELLYPYSTKTSVASSGQKLLMNTICPSAADPSNGIGSAVRAWGPYNQMVGGLNVRDQYGSYALNGNLYSNNPPPPMVSSLTSAVGLIAGSVNTKGNHSVIGDSIVTGNVKLQGFAQITGRTTTWNTSTVSGTSNVYLANPSVPGDVVRMTTPDVWGFYNQFAAAANVTYASVPATLNFNAYPVIRITGNANFSAIDAAHVQGAGTVVVDGNVTDLPWKQFSPAPAFNIICKGDVDIKNGTLAGSIYCVGDVDGNGGGKIYGNVVTLGVFGGNGGPDIVAAAFPSWDTTYLQPGQVQTISAYASGNNSTLIPVFADSIWAEAWPVTTDALPTDTNAGSMSSGLGRYYIKRHGQGINVGFLDGHVEGVDLPKLRSLKWSQQF